jgi:hypothetical protein
MEVQKYVDAFKAKSEGHVKAICHSLIDDVVVLAIQDAVDASENKIDDILAASLLATGAAAAHAAIDAVKL